MNKLNQKLGVLILAALMCQMPSAYAKKAEKKAKAEHAAAPAHEAPAPVAAPVHQEEGRYGKQNRPLGNWQVGPYVSGGIPLIAGGAEVKWRDTWGFSTQYGFFPQVTIASAKLKMDGWDIRAKFYPWKRAFFVGLGVGSMQVRGEMTRLIAGINTTGVLEQNITFLAPHVGWNWTWHSGFFLGVDIGAEFAMKTNTSFRSNVENATVTDSADYAALQADIKKKSEDATKILPLVSLIKVGYFF